LRFRLYVREYCALRVGVLAPGFEHCAVFVEDYTLERHFHRF
jgi:hypothetical protein